MTLPQAKGERGLDRDQEVMISALENGLPISLKRFLRLYIILIPVQKNV